MAQSDWKVIWITGASTGIGAALVDKLKSTGAVIAASARSQDKLDALANSTDNVKAFPLDVTDQEATKACISQIGIDHGPIDLAILNAGTWALTDAIDFNLEDIRSGVNVNYLGVVGAVHALLPSMLARGKGHIAITASVAGYRGLPNSIAYGPTKAALINLAELLKCELEPRGITVSVINPGFVDTPMTKDNPFPMPGIITAEDAAEHIVAGLKKKHFEIAFPRAFSLVMKMLRIMPNRVYFWTIKSFVIKK